MLSRPTATRTTATRVLVIDDDAEYRLGMRAALEKAGLEVYEAENGLAGLEVCRAAQPSVILLDIVMPVMDGADFLKVKLADSRIMFIPVIVISSHELPVGLRVTRQLRKPVSMEMLLSIIRVVVGVSRWGNS
jgi:CheY-like chemotaxis protein